MKVIQVYENINPIKSFNDYSEFHILMMLSSAYLWNKHNKTKPDLYCDNVTSDLLEKMNVTHLWNSIDTSILSKPTNLNKKTFWASSKLLVIDTIQEPFIILDVDFLSYCNLEDMIENSEEDVIYSHDEDGRNYYLTKDSDEVKQLSNYPLFKTWSPDSLNVSFLSFKNVELKNKYTSMAIGAMNEFNINMGTHDINYNLMTFCEQKILKEILLNNPEYTSKTLIKEYYSCRDSERSSSLHSKNYMWDYNESFVKFKHYGPSKNTLMSDLREIDFFNKILYNEFNDFNLRKLLKNIKIIFSEKNPQIFLFKYFIEYSDKLFNYIFLDSKRTKYISHLINNDVDISTDIHGSYIIEFNSKNFIGIQFLIKNVEFNKFSKTEFTKQYHYNTIDSKYNDNFEENKLLNKFDLKNFFDFYHLNTNIFEFDHVDDKKYYLISNEEFIVDFEYYHNQISCNVHFNNNKKYNIIICSESDIEYYKNNIKTRNILLPHEDIITYDILDYFVFGGFRFSNKDISKNSNLIKKNIKELFCGLNYYICGSAIFKENPEDIDIYVCDKNSYESMESILNKEESYKFVKTTDNSMKYIHKNQNISIDIIKEFIPYDVKNNELSIRDLYLDLCQAYTNTLCSDCTELRKKYRYNKIVELYYNQQYKNKLPEWNHPNFNYLDNSVTSFEEYYKLMNDNNFEDIEILSNGSCLCKLILKDFFYYLIIKPKYKSTDRFKITIPFLIKEIEVLSAENSLKDIVFMNNLNTTDIEASSIRKYCLIKFKKI